MFAMPAVCVTLLPSLLPPLKGFASVLGQVASIWNPYKGVPLFWKPQDPLIPCLFILLCAILLAFLWSLATKNCSHVDRAWSILPMFYVSIFARQELAALISKGPSGVLDWRLLLQLGLTTLWGSRLTYNFYRKGGYRLTFEDYRWAVVRKLMSPALFQLFNLVFVACAQLLLCLLLTCPAYVAWQQRGQQPLGPLDWAATALMLLLLLGETVADQQQWAFQSEKHRRLAAHESLGGDYELGFLTHGLFSLSRHPNFFCEMGIWWCFYLFSVSSTGGCFLNWTLAGPLGLMLVFHGSTWLTEEISEAKYPAYEMYKRTTSRILPWLPGPPVMKAKAG